MCVICTPDPGQPFCSCVRMSSPPSRASPSAPPKCRAPWPTPCHSPMEVKMPLALCCMSHTPLLELTSPPAEVKAEVTNALARARDFVAEFDPELVVVFVPDHYN